MPEGSSRHDTPAAPRPYRRRTRGRVAHLSADQIAAARKADAADPKTAAILAFAAAVNDGRGTVTSENLDSARAAGVTGEEIAETISHVALNVLTNYFNKAAGVGIDFPVVSA